MKTNQLNRGHERRIMYIENKDGDLDGVSARVGWVEVSKSGRTIYYRGKTLQRHKSGGIGGSYFDAKAGEEYWLSGITKKGTNTYPREPSISMEVDEDALKTYHQLVPK